MDRADPRGRVRDDTAGVVGAGWVRFIFFPEVEADFMIASLTMPQGTPVEATSRAVAQLEASAPVIAISAASITRSLDRR